MRKLRPRGVELLVQAYPISQLAKLGFEPWPPDSRAWSHQALHYPALKSLLWPQECPQMQPTQFNKRLEGSKADPVTVANISWHLAMYDNETLRVLQTFSFNSLPINSPRSPHQQDQSLHFEPLFSTGGRGGAGSRGQVLLQSNN